MKWIYFFVILFAFACNEASREEQTTTDTAITVTNDTLTNDIIQEPKDTAAKDSDKIKLPKDSVSAQVYSNKRFKDVTVEKIGEHKFRIRGKGQIFEANFSWVVEDGHEELKSGHQMTDAGAPEWGDFNFTIDVKKKRLNSTLHLILFEISAEDGSRQYELPIKLY